MRSVWDHKGVMSLSWAQTPAPCLTEGSSPLQSSSSSSSFMSSSNTVPQGRCQAHRRWSSMFRLSIPTFILHSFVQHTWSDHLPVTYLLSVYFKLSFVFVFLVQHFHEFWEQHPSPPPHRVLEYDTSSCVNIAMFYQHSEICRCVTWLQGKI